MHLNKGALSHGGGCTDPPQNRLSEIMEIVGTSQALSQGEIGKEVVVILAMGNTTLAALPLCVHAHIRR
jgi:hypothetical protein